jgi:hypothetical protein
MESEVILNQDVKLDFYYMYFRKLQAEAGKN